VYSTSVALLYACKEPGHSESLPSTFAVEESHWLVSWVFGNFWAFTEQVRIVHRMHRPYLYIKVLMGFI
ncbi:MAG TPA: hypothetical protein DIT07_04440, partial [Sphingobacteriaceae bacterium]|nr:hypothetical protein [Sphingobacteriaceae bacterium]